MLLRRFALLSLILLLTACGGGGGGDAPTVPSPLSPGTPVTITFAGTLPNAAAVSIANGVFVSATLSSNTLTFLVPAGTNAYAFAVACPAVNVLGTLVAEYAYAANLSDGTAYTVSPCLTAAAATGAATGTFDISAISFAVKARIVGALGYSGDVNGVTGAFSVPMPTGTNDVAVLALDGVGNILAVKILRSQTVPGAINAGAMIVVGIADEVMNQPVTIVGLPPRFVAPPALNVTYLTANRTLLTLSNGSFVQYPAISLADVSALDQYQISSNSANLAINESMGTSLYTANGTPVTLTYPPVWIYTPPAASQFPTFSFTYTGFSALARQTYRGQITWQSAGVVNAITAYATAAYLGIQTSVTIPNLTALPGFFGRAPSGTTVNWLSQIDGGSFPSYLYPPPVPGSLSFVQARGTYVEP